MRSGYFHPITKNDFVISGEIEVWILTPEGTEKKIYKSRDRFLIPAYTPHILHFLEDSVIAESWDHLGEIRCWLYHPYRRIVDVQNSLISTSIGEHHILVPQNHHDQHQPSAFASFLSGIGGMFWLGTGIAIGVYVGSALSKPR